MNRLQRILSRLFMGGVIWLGIISSTWASIIAYDFDTFDDSVVLTNQYAGLNFTNATLLKSGINLNGLFFPSHFADNVVFDDNGPIVISFETLAQGVSGYFTYLQRVTLAAYENNNNLLAIATSANSTILADGSGDPVSSANELLSVTAVGDLIARIEICASPDKSSVVLDDLTVVTAANPVPEPGTLVLVIGGLAHSPCLAMPMRAGPDCATGKLNQSL